jgi:hypothetical protein
MEVIRTIVLGVYKRKHWRQANKSILPSQTGLAAPEVAPGRSARQHQEGATRQQPLGTQEHQRE